MAKAGRPVRNAERDRAIFEEMDELLRAYPEELSTRDAASMVAEHWGWPGWPGGMKWGGKAGMLVMHRDRFREIYFAERKRRRR